MVIKFFEFKEYDFSPIDSFYLKDELDPKIWNGYKLDDQIEENLTQIGKDFYESTEIKAKIKDIVLCGSLCNYNWSEKYSDYDVHIVIDFYDINDSFDLVDKLCDYAKKIWNINNDIEIKGYEVEVSIQHTEDLSDGISSGRMGGAYSLLNSEWIKKPKKENFIPDEKSIKRKSKSIMQVIDGIEEKIDEYSYSKFRSKITKIWKKIKKLRESSLKEGSEFGVGNLIFKLLRRNGYISKIMKLKKYAYEKQFESVEEDLLKLCYLLDSLQNQAQILDGDSFTNIEYFIDEENETVEIKYSTAGFSDSFSENILVYYNTNPILAKFKTSENSGYGNYKNASQKTFNSFDDLIYDIKQEIKI